MDTFGPLDPLTSEKDPILDAAKAFFGIPYLFPYQRLAVHNILCACGFQGLREEEDAPGGQIVILPTGGGKSLCFQLPAALLPGLTVVVYPLLSLMADQERRLLNAGLACRVLRGGQSREERESLFREAAEGRLRVLLTNPESLAAEGSRRRLAELEITHFVIDEAHGVSEWGETFRPAYLSLGETIRALGPRVVTAFTATASPAVLDRVIHHLFPEESPNLVSADPDRPNIRYSVLPVLAKDAALAALLGRGEGGVKRPAVVFCRSRSGAELTAAGLRLRLGEKEIYFYHAGLEKEEKKKIENIFFRSSAGILAATCAYGLGIDKADIRTVIHRDVPGSVEAYLQESGRGGRDGAPAEAVLLWSSEDLARLDQSGSPGARARFAAMLDCLPPGGCRRSRLLALLGRDPPNCSGCDICDGAAVLQAPGEAETVDFISRNRRRFTGEEAALALSGLRDFRTITRELQGLRGFGALRGFDEKDAAEALGELVRRGRIRRLRRFPWKGRLTLSGEGPP